MSNRYKPMVIHWNVYAALTPREHAPDRVGSHVPYCKTQPPGCQPKLTRDKARVTCKNCLRKLRVKPNYCGEPLVGGWCKRARGHYGNHACS